MMGVKVAIATDHRGVALKNELTKWLADEGCEVSDFGAYDDSPCDYPDVILPAAETLKKGECDLAVGICYTGIGSSIAANKVKGVRASLCKTEQEAELTRQHNDSNMLILGSGFLEAGKGLSILKAWVGASFEGGRHANRVDKIKQYENK